jgi:hypothetical protein
VKCSTVGNLWRSENDWYVDGDGRDFKKFCCFLVFVIVALQPKITSNLTGNCAAGKIIFSNTFLSSGSSIHIEAIMADI